MGPPFEEKFFFIDTDTLDEFGLRPNQLPDIRDADESGMPTIRGPGHNRLSLRRRKPDSTPTREATPPESSQNTGPSHSDGYPISQNRYITYHYNKGLAI